MDSIFRLSLRSFCLCPLCQSSSVNSLWRPKASMPTALAQLPIRKGRCCLPPWSNQPWPVPYHVRPSSPDRSAPVRGLSGTSHRRSRNRWQRPLRQSAPARRQLSLCRHAASCDSESVSLDTSLVSSSERSVGESDPDLYRSAYSYNASKKRPIIKLWLVF